MKKNLYAFATVFYTFCLAIALFAFFDALTAVNYGTVKSDAFGISADWMAVCALIYLVIGAVIVVAHVSKKTLEREAV